MKTATQVTEITFCCPECRQSLCIIASARGLQVECPICHRQITVPQKRHWSRVSVGFLIGGLSVILLGATAWLLWQHKGPERPALERAAPSQSDSPSLAATNSPVTGSESATAASTATPIAVQARSTASGSVSSKGPFLSLSWFTTNAWQVDTGGTLGSGVLRAPEGTTLIVVNLRLSPATAEVRSLKLSEKARLEGAPAITSAARLVYQPKAGDFQLVSTSGQSIIGGSGNFAPQYFDFEPEAIEQTVFFIADVVQVAGGLAIKYRDCPAVALTETAQKPAEFSHASEGHTQATVVAGDFTTAIVRSDKGGSANPGRVLVFPKSKLWSQTGDNGSKPVTLESVFLLKPGSVLFVADGGVDGNVLSENAKGVGGGGRADLVIKYVSFNFNGTKTGLGTAMFENGLFLETTGQLTQHPQLRAGHFYKVGAQGLIEAAKRGEYSVRVSFGSDQEIRSGPSTSSAALYKLQRGEEVGLLMPGETPIAWHKVRSLGPKIAEGWVRAQWNSVTFLTENTTQTIQGGSAVSNASQTSDSAQETARESRQGFEQRYGIAAASGPASSSEVAGPSLATRTAREGAFNSPPKNWPKANGELSGVLKVTIRNPNDFQVRVGLRSGGRGRDFVVPANDARSVTVPNGRYDIYFQYSNDPEGLYQGDSFTLNNSEAEIQIVKVVDGNYGIRRVN